MDLRLYGSTAFVSVGAQRVSFAITDRLHQEGVRLAVADIDGGCLLQHEKRWSADGPAQAVWGSCWPSVTARTGLGLRHRRHRPRPDLTLALSLV